MPTVFVSEKGKLGVVEHYVRASPPQESLDQTFSKVCRVLGRRPESTSAEVETPNRRERAGELNFLSVCRQKRREPTRQEAFSCVGEKILKKPSPVGKGDHDSGG